MEQNLTKLGLTETEAKIYLAALSLGQSLAATIAKQAGVKRTTAYSALDNLIRQGLISEIADSKERKFKAEEPDRLMRLTKKMRRQTIEAEIELEKLLPGLKAIQKKLIEPPKITFYQGTEGIKNIVLQASECPETWYYFGTMEAWLKFLPEKDFNILVSESRELRGKAGRPVVYGITDPGYYNVKQFKDYAPSIRQAKILPELAKSKSILAIFGNKIALTNIADIPFGAIIESTEIAELIKMMFMFMWNSLPEEKPKK
ncbi:hypothetical protein D4R52_00130 [bacterium]|nr:MAG: hypothetical protein D4R52_00130 [bacterium]